MKKLSLLFLSILTFGWGISQSDNCSTATTMDLSSGSACASGTTVNATSTNTMYSNCNANPVNEVWYTFVTNGSVNTFDITSSGITDPQIVIYTGGCANFLELCDNATGTNPLSVNWGIPAGTQVWVGVMSNEGTEGGFDLCITSTAPDPSGGNTCGSAIEICDPNDVLTIDVSTLSPSGEWPSCFGASANQDVWFQFTVLQSGTIEWEANPVGVTSGVELDWAMYDVTSNCNGSDIDCNYNYANANGSAAGMSSNPPNGPSGGEYNAPYNVTAGNTYAILVDYYTGGSTGTLDFQITGGTAVITPVADFTISPTTVQCAPSVDITITDNSIGNVTWDFGNGNTYNGSNPPTQTFMASGTYAITATATAGNCSSTQTEFVQVFGPMVVTPTSTDETCAGDCDGSAAVQVTGGSGSFDYSWSNGSTQPTVSGLCSGALSVTVTDPVCNSTDTQNFTITGPSCLNCLITNITANVSACDPATNTYSTTGTVEFTDAPTTGSLTVTDCNGVQQVFTAPFTSPINYSLTGQTPDGAACDITATFSDEPTCTANISYTAPVCLCYITNFFAQIGACEPTNNTFQVSGDIEFQSPPSTGTLNIEVDNGTTIYDTIINLPFSSPSTWSISNIPADGSALTISAYFSADATCTTSLTTTAPDGCQCTAIAGTFSASTTGDGINDYVLCFGDQFDVSSNNDFTSPADENISGITYDPGIAYLAYTCPPTVFPTDPLWDPNTGVANDPCLLGVVQFGSSLTDINTNGDVPFAGSFTDQTIYYVPITTYSNTDGYYAISINNGPWCYDMGTPFAVQYLPEVTSTVTPDCATGTVTVSVSGGLPQIDGSSFTASNLSPSTATFDNTTTTNGGNIVISGLQDGDMYSFDITDGNGCPHTISGGPFVGAPVAAAGPDDFSCTLSYTLNATASVGTGTWTSSPSGATFSNANSATSSVTVSTPGSYTFTWTEVNGACSSTDDVIVEFSDLTYTDNITQSTCGNPDGAITLTASNGIVSYQYSIDGGANFQASGTFSNLLAGTYNVVVEDANGCQVTGTSTVSDQGGPVINSVTTTDISCNAACDGTIGINATGATQYSIDNGSTFQAGSSFSSLCANTYNIVVQDANGCQANDVATITEPAVLDATVTANDLVCDGACTGQIDIAATGGTVSYSYSIDGGATTQAGSSFTSLCAGTNNVVVEDQNGCQYTETIVITALPPITSTITEDCVGGTATVTLNGGYPQAYGTNFAISNLQPATASLSSTSVADGGSTVISGLLNGDMYSFDVIDDNGCTLTVSGGPFIAAPTANAGADANVCALTYNLSATASYGTGTWTSNPAGATFSNANSPTSSVTVTNAGSYTFTWTEDNGGCTDADDVVVQFSDIQYTEVVNSSTCGNADGDITLSGNSGIPTYIYSIDGGATTQASGSFTGLLANTYNIVVEDAIGCQSTGTITVTDLGGPTIDAVGSTDITCNAACNGDISISATGATQFSIDNGATYAATNTFTSLCAGSYDIVVQDAIGCVATSSVTLTEPAALTHTTSQVDLLCANDCNGQISISESGGTAPFQYSIDNGTTNQSSGVFQNLCVGTYNILVTDANGCTTNSQVTLTEPAPLSVTIGITDASCYGMCDGMMNSIPSGGTGPGTYSYSWSPAVGGNVPLVTNLCAGTYSLTITDGNGCTIDSTGIVVGAPQPVTIDNVVTVPETCGGDCTGSLTITASNATQYSLDGTTWGASNSFSNLCAGTYNVYAQDVNGCSANDQADIVGPAPVDVVASGSTTICIGQSTALTSVASGGVGGYTYAWDNNSTTQNINVSPTGSMTYCVIATDANGCDSPTSCVNVNVNPPLSVVALSDQAICEGDGAVINAVGSGGNGGPYTYNWDQSVGSGQVQTVSPSATTTYTVSVSDGCTTPDATASVTITVNTIPNISFSADNLDGCYPVDVNFTEVNVPAGSSCLWSFGDGGASTDCSNASYSFENPGCWDVTLSIITPEGCESTSTVADYICVYDYPQPYFTFDPQPTTELESTIYFTNLTEGASTYNWTFDTDGAGSQSTTTDPSYTFPEVGSFEVCLDVESANGCPATYCDTVVILEEFIVYVPNAFSPDGDGINDGFAPIISGVMPNSYEFMVFNRWGQLIYDSQIVGLEWDGTYKNVMSQEDVYVWKLKVDDQLGKTHEYIGHVTLVK